MGDAQGLMDGFRNYLFGNGFLARASLVELALGMVIVGAIERIVASLISDIMIPLLGIFGKWDFSNYFVGLSRNVTSELLADAREEGQVFAYGDFATTLVNGAVVALAVWCVFKLTAKFRPHC